MRDARCKTYIHLIERHSMAFNQRRAANALRIAGGSGNDIRTGRHEAPARMIERHEHFIII